jgi:hypothetical protein
MKIVSIENKRNEFKMNVKPKFFKVMKQKIFTLIMMLALVIVAGSAFGQTKFAPFKGGTYSYAIPIELANAGSFTLAASTPANAPITNVVPAIGAIPQTTTSVTFDIAYPTGAATGDDTITFVLTDVVSGCTNTIYAIVDIQAPPTYTLTIAKNVGGYSECQARNGVSDRSASALGTDIPAEANSFTFTVTPAFTGLPATYDFDYNIALTGGTGILNSFSNGSGSVTGYSGGVVSRDETNVGDDHDFVVTFNTTTGIATETMTATLTLAGSELTLPAIYGGGTYTATMASGGSIEESVDAKAVPTIGGFN